MNSKHYLVISGIIGGVIGSLLTALLVTPVTAQWEKFEVVECSKLRIVDEYGTTKIELGSALEDGYLEIRGYLKILGPESGNIPVILLASRDKRGDERGGVFVRGDVSVLNDELGYIFWSDHTTAMIAGQRVAQLSAGEDGTGSVTVVGKDYKGLAMLKVIEQEGFVFAYGNDGEAKVGLSVDEHGGRVDAYGKDGKLCVTIGTGKTGEHGGIVGVFGRDGGVASLGVDEHGGNLIAYGKDRKSSAQIGIDEHGGWVAVEGKGEGSAIMGINEYGNGAVSTRDKNRYRQK